MSNSYIALSRKDVTAGVERKGNLDYLSWAYAWNALCEEHPDANFYFAEPATYPDGSVMVKAVVTVGEKDPRDDAACNEPPQSGDPEPQRQRHIRCPDAVPC